MSRTFVDGKVHVRETRCETCIFRPGNLMDLEDGRVEQMVRDADKDDSCIPCHAHLYNNADIEPVCRGYYERGSSMALRFAAAMGVIEFHDPTEGGEMSTTTSTHRFDLGDKGWGECATCGEPLEHPNHTPAPPPDPAEPHSFEGNSAWDDCRGVRSGADAPHPPGRQVTDRPTHTFDLGDKGWDECTVCGKVADHPNHAAPAEVWMQAAGDGIEPLAKLPPGAAGPDWHGLDHDALTAAHCAVEQELVELRDARISVLGPRNGFIINERDGTPSPMLRLGTRDGLAIAIGAYHATLTAKRSPGWPGLHAYLIAQGWIEDPLDVAADLAFGPLPPATPPRFDAEDYIVHDPDGDE